MTTKIYKLVGMDACLMKTVYCGVTVNMEFKSGNHMNGKHAVLITKNPFVQDAIEHDARFGSVFKLAAIYENKEEEQPSDLEKEPQSSREAKMMRIAKEKAEKEKAEKGKRGKTSKEMAGKENNVSELSDGYKEVPEVKNVNDAIEYFAGLGEMLENEEQIAEMADKHRVKFVNLTM